MILCDIQIQVRYLAGLALFVVGVEISSCELIKRQAAYQAICIYTE